MPRVGPIPNDRAEFDEINHFPQIAENAEGGGTTSAAPMESAWVCSRSVRGGGIFIVVGIDSIDKGNRIREPPAEVGRAGSRTGDRRDVERQSLGKNFRKPAPGLSWDYRSTQVVLPEEEVLL